MKLRVDAEMCQGHSRCYAAYPEMFDIDGDGIAFVTMETIPPEWEDRAHNAIANCPERAIHIVKESP
ncbi:ferredoxin [Mycobacterium sp. 852002-30065_SCH5024008]|uniref:ferredoxin n=1 Tax=Mycobacterium sp. 852002-30065_SCH5024008 TaxID=1834088 RepID=UPI0008010E31|nr:ferredoxin [Mycobacterium sp. 852002-30065_SCH5024008]OBB90003.1 ferredoxin [Mycobacterium sp. 852002-30065_SCH5024008]